MIWNFDKYKDKIAILDELGTALSYGSLKASGQKIADIIGKM